MIIGGRIVDYDAEGGVLYIQASYPRPLDVIRKQYRDVEIRLDDSRKLSNDQRRKARAIVADIAQWAGYDIRTEANNLHEQLKADYCIASGERDFSLSNCSVTTAREYITYLIDFCLRNGVPSLDTLLNKTDDINAYLYSCLYYRKCCICGRPAEVHHVDRVGMGRDRRSISHEGMKAMALCRKHHTEVHATGQSRFNELNHVYGVELDRILVRHLALGKIEGDELWQQ